MNPALKNLANPGIFGKLASICGVTVTERYCAPPQTAKALILYAVISVKIEEIHHLT